jgi:hypothetical protein
MSDSPSPLPLEYRPAQPRRIPRLIASLLITASLASAAYYWRFPIQHYMYRFRYTYAINRCLHQALPPNQIVWQSDPTQARRLLATNSNYHLFFTSAGWVSTEFNRLLHTPVSINGAPPGIPGTVPGCWWPWVNLSPGADIFLHERITPHGQHVLLLVRASFDPSNNHELQIETVAFEVGTFDHPGGHSLGGLVQQANCIFTHRTGNITQLWNETDPLQIFAGFPDPADPSRLHIPFTLAGTSSEFQIQVLESPNPSATFPLETHFTGPTIYPPPP